MLLAPKRMPTSSLFTAQPNSHIETLSRGHSRPLSYITKCRDTTIRETGVEVREGAVMLRAGPQESTVLKMTTSQVMKMNKKLRQRGV